MTLQVSTLQVKSQALAWNLSFTHEIPHVKIKSHFGLIKKERNTTSMSIKYLKKVTNFDE